MDNLLITKDTLRVEHEKKVSRGEIAVKEPVGYTPTIIGGKIDKANDEAIFNAAMAASQSKQSWGHRVPKMVAQYGSAFDVPMHWSDGATASVRERIAKGKLTLPRDPQASTNTLLPDWQNLWEAVRLDISIRKEAMPTVRQFMYNEIQNPNASRTMKISELFPYGVVFHENNGEGQQVVQGQTRGGNYDSITHLIYAAGFTWTLLAELFDESLDMSRIADAVALGYNAKRDDLAIDPILSYSWGSTSDANWTAANSDGDERQEDLYLTIEDAIDDIGDRPDPITGRNISATGLVCLASEYDARHISRVAQGLPNDSVRSYPALSEISRVIGYDGETIQLRNETITYDGVTSGYAYLIKPNRYMLVSIKRGMQVEIDMQPNVNTLSRQERAYWFSEVPYYAGIEYFVQKITLPTW